MLPLYNIPEQEGFIKGSGDCMFTVRADICIPDGSGMSVEDVPSVSHHDPRSLICLPPAVMMKSIFGGMSRAVTALVWASFTSRVALEGFRIEHLEASVGKTGQE